uniref:Uncharacterized protein n=1 Tax=Rhizophora mucronata TaxID=61149 RepID=A0A2P2PDZ2_RHIMU
MFLMRFPIILKLCKPCIGNLKVGIWPFLERL